MSNASWHMGKLALLASCHEFSTPLAEGWVAQQTEGSTAVLRGAWYHFEEAYKVNLDSLAHSTNEQQLDQDLSKPPAVCTLVGGRGGGNGPTSARGVELCNLWAHQVQEQHQQLRGCQR